MSSWLQALRAELTLTPFESRHERSDSDVMDSGSPEVTANQEPLEVTAECPVKKKSKLKTLKKFFTRKKRKGGSASRGEAGLKASQSSDSVNNILESNTLVCSEAEGGSKVSLGSKALSHDSVFVSDSLMVNETQGTSQDNIHGNDRLIQVQRKSSLSLEATEGIEQQCEQSAAQLPPQADFSSPPSLVFCLDHQAARHRLGLRQQACAHRKPARRAVRQPEVDLSTSTPKAAPEKEEEEDEEESRAERGEETELSPPPKPSPSKDEEQEEEEEEEEDAGGGKLGRTRETSPSAGQTEEQPEDAQEDSSDLLGAEESKEESSFLLEVLSSLKTPLITSSCLQSEDVPLTLEEEGGAEGERGEEEEEEREEGGDEGREERGREEEGGEEERREDLVSPQAWLIQEEEVGSVGENILSCPAVSGGEEEEEEEEKIDQENDGTRLHPDNEEDYGREDEGQEEAIDMQDEAEMVRGGPDGTEGVEEAEEALEMEEGEKRDEESEEEREEQMEEREEQTVEIEEQTMEIEEQTVEIEEQTVEIEEQTVEIEEQTEEREEQTEEREEQTVEIEEQTVEIEEPTVEIEEQTVEIEEQTMEIEEPTVDIEEQTEEIEEQMVEIEEQLDEREEQMEEEREEEVKQELGEEVGLIAEGEAVQGRQCMLGEGAEPQPPRADSQHSADAEGPPQSWTCTSGVPTHPQPDVLQPDVPQPDVLQPDVPQPDVLQPDVLQPGVLQPDVLLPDVLQPDVDQPDTAEEAVCEPDVHQCPADGTQTDTQPAPPAAGDGTEGGAGGAGSVDQSTEQTAELHLSSPAQALELSLPQSIMGEEAVDRSPPATPDTVRRSFTAATTTKEEHQSPQAVPVVAVPEAAKQTCTRPDTTEEEEACKPVCSDTEPRRVPSITAPSRHRVLSPEWASPTAKVHGAPSPRRSTSATPASPPSSIIRSSAPEAQPVSSRTGALPSGTPRTVQLNSPFGVRLRRTALLQEDNSKTNVESPIQSQPMSEKPCLNQPISIKPAIPRKPEIQADSGERTKHTQETSGLPSRGSGSPAAFSTPPSWISVARQKHKIYKDHSLDDGSAPKQEERRSSLPLSVDSTASKEQAKSSRVEPQKPEPEVQRSGAATCSLVPLTAPRPWTQRSLPSPTKSPLSSPPGLKSFTPPAGLSSPPTVPPRGVPISPPPQEQPPWMALAKKKAKAWSEMPQIVQ